MADLGLVVLGVADLRHVLLGEATILAVLGCMVTAVLGCAAAILFIQSVEQGKFHGASGVVKFVD